MLLESFSMPVEQERFSAYHLYTYILASDEIDILKVI